MEKSPRDLPLYAQSVLQVLITVLRSKDLTMVEESIPTFETFCAHHDIAALASDQEHNRQYEELVRTYAGFASSAPPVQIKGPIAVPVAIRWRSVGLQAIKSIASSEALSSDGGRRMNLIMPAILNNLYSANGGRLRTLQQRARTSETTDIDQAVRRRMSIATVRTFEEQDIHPITLSATADDADKLAEEEVGLLALQSLRQIFVVNNRAQIRLATTCFLSFVVTKTSWQSPDLGLSSRSSGTGGWSTTLIEMIARWTPVQDRFVILVTTMETLVRSPVTEQNLEQQLVLATLVSWLLSSTVNMIGLSVMDVLLGLIQHILLLLQLGGKGSNVLPHHQQIDGLDLFQDAKEAIDEPSSTESIEKTALPIAFAPSVMRQELLFRLQKCIGDLATHIYYSDQISDMIEAIFLRLKPSPMSGINTAAAAIEHPAAAAEAISRSVNLQEDPKTDGFFSFDTARVTALKAIKDILTIANVRGSAPGATAIVRNKVSVLVWEGTQWLLRDLDRGVRRAYVDALLTWLKLEMSPNDLRVMEDRRKLLRSSARNEGGAHPDLRRGAISSVSQRDKAPKPPKSTFLPLLHLAIYDNAIESPESESEISLLHLVLTSLVEKLGVNAVKSGLPMIVRLQEDINNDDIIATPLAKVNVGGLVHGYFWALSEKFDFDTSRIGYEIHSEISRRKRKGLWVDKIRLPPIPLDQIRTSGSTPITEKQPLPVFERESLKPFDARQAMVELIDAAYATSMAEPPPSAPSSPGRVASIPTITTRTASQTTPPDHRLPSEIKQAMLSDWSKEACIASVEKESAKTTSVNGSRSGTTPSNARAFLAVNGNGNGNSRTQSPQGGHHRHHHEHGSRPPSAAYGLVGGLGDLQRLRRTSAQDGSPTRISTSSQTSTVRVDELKRVLAGGRLPRNGSPLRLRPRSVTSSPSPSPSGSSTGSNSVASGDLSGSDNVSDTHVTENIASTDFASHTQAQTQTQMKPESREAQAQTTAPETLPLSALDEATVNAAALSGQLQFQLPNQKDIDDVPPVPPLPTSLSLSLSSSPPSTGTGVRAGQAQRPSTAPNHSHTQFSNSGAYLHNHEPVMGGGGGSRSLRHGHGHGHGHGSRRFRDRNANRHTARGMDLDIKALLSGIEVPSPGIGGRAEGEGTFGVGMGTGLGVEGGGIGRPPY